MDRLTCKGYKGKPTPVNYSNFFVWDLPHKTVVEYQKLVARLAEYEDTGLTPEEIIAMKERYAKC